MIVEWNGYRFVIAYDDPHFTATCQRTNNTKTRFDRNVWRNADGTRVNADLVKHLEQGVSDWKSANAPRRLWLPVAISVKRSISPNSERPKHQRRHGADRRTE